MVNGGYYTYYVCFRQQANRKKHNDAVFPNDSFAIRFTLYISNSIEHIGY